MLIHIAYLGHIFEDTKKNKHVKLVSPNYITKTHAPKTEISASLDISNWGYESCFREDITKTSRK